MNILVLGGGAREHALCYSLKKSKKCQEIFCAPGNAGIAKIAHCLSFNIEDKNQVLKACQDHKIDLVVIGPEAPLVAGIADALNNKDILCFGPSSKAAQLESSKKFMKEICDEQNIPTASYEAFTDANEAKAYIQKLNSPCVIKADGLAAGKGVIMAQTTDEALNAIDKIMVDKAFGEAGSEVIIEEWLIGEEMSYFCILDGKGNILPLTSAQDHKRIGEGDTGLNTGGMGAYSPAPSSDNDIKTILDHIVEPVNQAMIKKDIPFQGVLFLGLMMTKSGPKLLEINARFGDPEAQVILPRLQSDFLDIITHTAHGTLDQLEPLEWSKQVSLGVVMATKGYPESYPKNTPINDLDDIQANDNLHLYHAATSYQDKQYYSCGGRVLTVTALSDNFQTAQEKAYNTVQAIDWDEGYYRRDIGWRVLKEKAA